MTNDIDKKILFWHAMALFLPIVVLGIVYFVIYFNYGNPLAIICGLIGQIITSIVCVIKLKNTMKIRWL